MASEQAPAATVFDQRIGKLKLEIKRFATGDSFCVRLPGHNSGVAMEAYFHVVISKISYFGSFFLASPMSSARVVILPIELVSV